jgi:hypothetical protein
MKLREEHIDRICRTLLARWKEKGLIRPKAADEILLAKMAGEVVKDFRREEALDREVEALLEQHADKLQASKASSSLMFRKVKERLARERNIIL